MGLAHSRALAEVKIYHLRPDGPFWRLTLETGTELLARLFDTRDKALSTALYLAESEAPSRLLIFRDDRTIEAELDLKKTSS